MQRLSKSKKPIARMAKNQLSCLILNETLTTTLQKAKIVKSEAEALISKMSSEKDLLKLRRYLGIKLTKLSVEKAIDDKDKLKSVSTYKIGRRKGDCAQMAVVRINFVQKDTTTEVKEKKS